MSIIETIFGVLKDWSWILPFLAAGLALARQLLQGRRERRLVWGFGRRASITLVVPDGERRGDPTDIRASMYEMLAAEVIRNRLRRFRYFDVVQCSESELTDELRTRHLVLVGSVWRSREVAEIAQPVHGDFAIRPGGVQLTDGDEGALLRPELEPGSQGTRVRADYGIMLNRASPYADDKRLVVATGSYPSGVLVAASALNSGTLKTLKCSAQDGYEVVVTGRLVGRSVHQVGAVVSREIVGGAHHAAVQKGAPAE
jgi:hypothetical protein